MRIGPVYISILALILIVILVIILT